jgi:hypothetical protein
MEKREFLHAVFGQAREELSVGKSTNHVVLEGSHYWAMFMLEMWPMCL